MKIHTLVYTFEDALDITQRHLPLWEKTTDTLAFVSPEDASVFSHQVNNHPCLIAAQSEHFGLESNKRTLAGLEWMAMTVEDDDLVVLQEYDSFSTRRLDGLDTRPSKGWVATHRQFSAQAGFESPIIPWWPQVWWGSDLKLAVEALRKADPLAERGYADRYVGHGIWKAGLNIQDLHKQGLTFCQWTIGPEHLPLLDDAIKGGAFCFHGVKTTAILKHILKRTK